MNKGPLLPCFIKKPQRFSVPLSLFLDPQMRGPTREWSWIFIASADAVLSMWDMGGWSYQVFLDGQSQVIQALRGLWPESRAWVETNGDYIVEPLPVESTDRYMEDWNGYEAVFGGV